MGDKAIQIQLRAEGETSRLVLPSDFRVEGAKAFAILLGRVLQDKPAALILDASAVERVDTAALQALVVAWRGAAQAGIAASWEACPPQLHDSARLMGLATAAGIER